MKEAILIFLVMAVLLALTAFRYRHHLIAFHKFWKAMKQARAQGARRSNEIQDPLPINLGPLVNCAKCGMWIPESKAIKLGARTYYCSAACVENAAKAA